MQAWAKVVQRVKNREEELKFGIVAANNHYAGFGLATANGFRKMLSMKEVIWDEMKQARLD
jgi:hypothetical protein